MDKRGSSSEDFVTSDLKIQFFGEKEEKNHLMGVLDIEAGVQCH